jgi:hypothetical protein
LAFSRRMFLRHGVLAAAACAGSPLMAFGGRRTANGDDAHEPAPRNLHESDNWQDHASALDHLGRSAFSGAVGTNFKVFFAGSTAPVWVTLLAVNDLPQIAPVNPASFAVANKGSGVAPTSSGFVLVFGGSSSLPQDTHLFEHSSLGRFALFTVPDGTQQVHTAVVNRLDAPTIVAVPFSAAQGGQPALFSAPAAGGINAPAATSLIDESPSHGPSGSQVVRRGVVRD